MTAFRTVLIALPLLTARLPAPALVAQSPAPTVPATTGFERRAAELPDLLEGRIAFADYFAPVFQQAVPEAQFKAIAANLAAQYGRPVAVVSTDAADARRGTVTLRFEKAARTVALSVEIGRAHV